MAYINVHMMSKQHVYYIMHQQHRAFTALHQTDHHVLAFTENHSNSKNSHLQGINTERSLLVAPPHMHTGKQLHSYCTYMCSRKEGGVR